MAHLSQSRPDHGLSFQTKVQKVRVEKGGLLEGYRESGGCSRGNLPRVIYRKVYQYTKKQNKLSPLHAGEARNLAEAGEEVEEAGRGLLMTNEISIVEMGPARILRT